MTELVHSLTEYGPAERRAIQEHKYFLGIERGYDPPLDEAIASWERFHAVAWRSRKMRREAEAQVEEIETHRRQMMLNLGEAVDFPAAFRDWILNHGDRWRERWEARMLEEWGLQGDGSPQRRH